MSSNDVMATYRLDKRIYQVSLTVSGDSVVANSPPSPKVYEQVLKDYVEPEVVLPEQVSAVKGKCKKCGKSKKAKPETQSDEKRSLAGMIKGAVGLAKSELRIGAASEEEVSNRRAICIGCDKQILGVCSECGCYCAAKVKIAKERCPIGKWGD
tara:strand:+ start:1504 stop:1965 length:462 start_codon:yes stop_codon:yes gene_type:complete